MRIIKERLDGYITSITEHKDVLTANQLNALKELVGEEDQEANTPILFQEFVPSELDTLFTLVKVLQAKVVTGSGDLLANATTRDLSSLIGGITSLLRAFSAQQQKVDEAKELGDLKQAVLAAIESLDSAAQQRFFKTLDSYS